MIIIDKEKTLKVIRAIDNALGEYKCSIQVGCSKCAYNKLCRFADGMMDNLDET